MCTLTFCLPGETPDTKELAESCRMNKDGYGFAVIGDGKIIVGKNMDAGKAMKAFYRIRRKYIDSPAIFHARIGTHGEHGLVNCHPFYVNREHTVVLAHNGILPVIAEKSDKRSDTAIFAEEYISRLLPVIDEPHIADMVTKYLGYNNKFVMLSVSEMLEKPWYIFNEDKGGAHWQGKKIWWSNRSYELPRQLPVRTSSYSPGHSTTTYEPFVIGERTWIEPVMNGKLIVTHGHYEYRGNDDLHRGQVWVMGKGWLRWTDASEDERKKFIDSEVNKKEEAKAAKDAHIKTDTSNTGPAKSSQPKSSTTRVYKADADGVYRWHEDGVDSGDNEEDLSEQLAAELQAIEDSDSKLSGEVCKLCDRLLTMLGIGQGCCTSCWYCQTCFKDVEECNCTRSEERIPNRFPIVSYGDYWGFD